MPEQFPANTDNNRDFEYFAFISYSRKDEKWAKMIQQDLEKYRLPMALYKESDELPKNIRPVFRDVTDLSAGQLQSELHRQLDDSKKLILICSPWAAKSEWVNREVRHFINSRGYENVIPFVVDGSPNGGENECFPEVLRLPEDQELLGISVRELGWRDAFLRVVSGLLDVKFDSLKRRHEQRRKRRNMIACAVAFLVLTLSGLAGYAAWDYYTPHEAYYADYVLRLGVPEGIGPLTAQQVSARLEHYIIVTQKRRVVSLTHANSAGVPVPHSNSEHQNRPMIARYYYGDNGNVRLVEYMDRNDRVLLAENYTPDLKAVDFIVSGSDSVFQTLALSSTSMGSGMLGLRADSATALIRKSDITRHELEYDENGFVTRIIYMRDNRRTPVPDSDGIGGLEYMLDDFGRPVEVRYLGLKGEGYTATNANVAGKRYAYDDAHNLVREEYIDPNGALVPNEQGWMITEIEYDANGNPLRQSSLDADGSLLPPAEGFAVMEWEYDARGNMIKESLYDADGHPFLNNLGFASVKLEYDDQGNAILWSAFDENGEPVLTAYGHFSIKREYDRRGNQISESYFDTDGNPAPTGDGYCSATIEYDGQGNVTKASYWGADDTPALTAYGYAAMEWEYDSYSRIIGTACYAADGLPCLNRYGYSSARLEYDERGNLARESRFGTDGQPVLSNDGFSSASMEYDAYGRLIGVSLFGTDGRLIPPEQGVAAIEWELDERGNMIREVYLGPDGRQILNDSGFSCVRLEYDERGNITSEAYFGPDGEPVLIGGGFSRVETEYDGLGNVIGESYFDADNRPIVLNEWA